MKSPAHLFTLLLFTLLLVNLTACGAAPIPAPSYAPAEQDALESPTEAAAYPEEDQMLDGEAKAPAAVEGNSDMPGSNTTVQTGADALTSANTGSRMVIKNGEVRLMVEETDTGIDRIIQIVNDVDGYIISSKVWYQDHSMGSFKYATITMGVPADQFENAMRRLRGIALKVLDENASGQDVSDEYVDLQSQLANLEATRDRIRSFLDDAKTVEESLKINQELSTIESEIEKVKGRMNYLSNRAAYSTITVTLEPALPPLTPTPTPTLTPTATPTTWNPGKTAEQAGSTIVKIYQGLIELAIWIVIVILPIVLPPAIIILMVYKLATRKK